MTVTAECFPCLLHQAINAAKSARATDTQILQILRETMSYMASADLRTSPARFSEPLYATVTRLTGVADPYAEQKKQSNAVALRLLRHARLSVLHSLNPLTDALRAAAAGNVIDAGIQSTHSQDIQKSLERLLRQPFAIDDVRLLVARLHRDARVLYLTDNAGEIVFDALAVGQIQRHGAVVTVAVKSGPIINDATREDAAVAELPKLCTVIETGSASIGLDLQRVSPEFRAVYEAADIVIAKGHGHLETLFDDPHPGLFFLLKAKCAVVARALHARVGDLVCAHAPKLRQIYTDT